MSQALFYPWIDIQDEAWLKTSLLYWDEVRTIVPESIDAPYSTNTGRALAEAGFLVPLRVHSGMDEIEELTEDVLSYLGTTEGAELLIAEGGPHRHDIHVEKLPYRLGRLAEMHPEKLPYEIRRMLRNLAAPSRRGPEWLHVDEGFADFYMTLLANRLADRVGARLLTSVPAADRLAVTARLDAQLNGLIPWGMRAHGRHWREYEAFGARRRMPRHLAPGLLANLAIEQVGIAPDTPIERLIEFREKHRDELAVFRTKVEQLAASVEADLSTEALRQRIADLHSHEVVPAISALKAALKGRRIKWLSDGLLKIAFLSAGASTMLAVAGLAVPTALLAGAGISLIATGTIYNVDKRESLLANPYAYLLSVERELS
ncbi:MAG: hypothetical protein HONDAALG_03856 [Gammaproteobacteria bacterium]|nr:hypothetical protein [Gammaproteobacteria bacterium]